MEHRVGVMQPASREQIVAIIRQRAERHRDRAAQRGEPAAAAGPAENPGGGAVPVLVPGAPPAGPPNAGANIRFAPPVAQANQAAPGGGQQQGGRRPNPLQDILAGPLPFLPAFEPPPPMEHDMARVLMAQAIDGIRMQREGGAVGVAGAVARAAAHEDIGLLRHRGQNPGGDGRAPMMGGAMAYLFRQASVAKEEAPRSRNISIQGNVISYKPEQDQLDGPGVYVGGRNLCPETNYFELEIIDKGASQITLSIGIVSHLFSLENLPGRHNDSYAFCPGDGVIFRGSEVSSPFGPRVEVGDKVGCGIRFGTAQPLSGKNAGSLSAASSGQLFFTHNSKEFGSLPINVPPGGFFPAMSISALGESVALKSGLRYIQEEDMMMVDNCDDDWLSLHDIRLNGPVLEYIGRGKSLVDVGLAQAKNPISTRHHYFEIEIIDPGLRCYIAIGLARKNYPKNRHPGWNRGSIAYHADDGKVFVGSGVGAPFGPRCHKGDIMGCGVLFPRNYEYRSDSDDELDPPVPPVNEENPFRAPSPAGVNGGVGGGGGGQNFPHFDYPSDSADDEDWWSDRNYLPYGAKVHIYFTRNGNVIGKREVRIPKGGFYPTVGMMSSEEKVRVDLRPLSG